MTAAGRVDALEAEVADLRREVAQLHGDVSLIANACGALAGDRRTVQAMTAIVARYTRLHGEHEQNPDP